MAHTQDADLLLPGPREFGSSSGMLPGSSCFHQIRVQCCNGLAHTDFVPAAIRAIFARCAILHGRLPGGMWCTAMLAGAATLPCGKIARACSHGVWGNIHVSFIHPLLHQIRATFCKSPMFSGNQSPTWTAHHRNQRQYKIRHSVWHGAPDGFIIPLLLQDWPLFYKEHV